MVGQAASGMMSSKGARHELKVHRQQFAGLLQAPKLLNDYMHAGGPDVTAKGTSALATHDERQNAKGIDLYDGNLLEMGNRRTESLLEEIGRRQPSSAMGFSKSKLDSSASPYWDR